MRPSSIRYRLPLLICGLVLGVTAVYAVAAYRGERASETRSATQRLHTLSNRLGGTVGGSIGLFTSATRGVAAYAPVRAFLACQESAGQSRATRPTLDPRPCVTASILDTTRTLTAHVHSTDSYELWDRTGHRLFRFPDRSPAFSDTLGGELLRLGAGRGGVTVGELHFIRDRLYFPVVAGIAGDSGSLGVVVQWLVLPSLSGKGKEFSDLVGADARVLLGNSRTHLWTDMSRPVAAPPVDVTAAAGAVGYQRRDGRHVLASAAPIANAPWTLLIEMSQDGYMRRVRAILGWQLLVAAILLAIAALTAWRLSQSIAKPLTKLSEAATAISEGDYARRVAVVKPDEIGALSQAFNRMAASIAEGRAQLEARIREREKAEEQLRATQERLQGVIASSRAVIYSRRPENPDVRIEWISDNVERLLGYTVAEALSPGWFDENIHPDDASAVLRSTLTAGELSHVFRFMNKEGEYRWIRDEQRVTRNADGASTEIVGAWLDITAQRLLEEQFRQAQKLEAVGRLAGGVAHDFNNLLTVILAECDFAVADLPPDDPGRQPFEQIRESGERAAHLTRQLLSFSRRELIAPVEFRLNEVVRGMTTMLTRLIGEDVQLTTRLGDDQGTVKADRGQVEQLVANLVVNARDAMPTGGTLIVETANVRLDDEYAGTHAGVTAGDYVMLSVSDTGCGMTAEVKAHLFEPFFTTKEHGRGTGLGLATCYGIVSQLGGHVRVYSEVGVGTTMRVYLPRIDSTSEIVAASIVARNGHGAETVFLVEDEAPVRTLVSRMLTSRGYTVLSAPNAEEALQQLECHRGPVHLLLSDVVLPGMGGRELADRARALRPALKLLFMSGYTDDVILQHRLLERDFTLLQKPFTTDALTGKVRAALEQ